MHEPDGDHWGVVPYEPDCGCCNDDAFVVYGDERYPCPQCRNADYEAAISSASPRKDQT